jgi:hypothetical protein
MTTYIRCHADGCHAFFEKKLRQCPYCATEIRGVNLGLLGGRFAAALNAKAVHAVKHT